MSIIAPGLEAQWGYLFEFHQHEGIIQAIRMSAQNIPFSLYKRKSPKIIPNLQIWDFFQGTQERVRNSRGKRATSVRGTEVLLYVNILLNMYWLKRFSVIIAAKCFEEGWSLAYKLLA